jgi:hypothetical protein
MSRLDRGGCVSERIYRRLLVAYPKQFRDAYGPHMAQVFRDLYREELRRGRTAGLVRLWVRTGLDLASTVVAERRSSHPNDREIAVNERRLAGVGFALLLAPLYFVSASLLKYGLGIGLLFDPLEDALYSDPQRLHVFNIVSPIIFLVGLGLALALNAYPVLQPNFGREDGAVVCTVRLRIKLLNIAVIVVSCALLVTLVGYAFLENLAYRY